jgi:hypothetical protein
MGNYNIIFWNVRRLNSYARRDVVHVMVAEERPSFICIQKTKLTIIDDYGVLQLLGHDFDYVFLPSIQTHWRNLDRLVTLFLVGLQCCKRELLNHN